jgi:transposase-like protein
VINQAADQGMPDPQVQPRPRRRTFSPAFRIRIVEEYERAENGLKGAVLRREGLYSSHLIDWRRQRDAGMLAAMSAKRGRKPKHPAEVEVAGLRKENARLSRELDRTRKVIDIQGNVFALLQELSSESANPNSEPDSTTP